MSYVYAPCFATSVCVWRGGGLYAGSNILSCEYNPSSEAGLTQVCQRLSCPPETRTYFGHDQLTEVGHSKWFCWKFLMTSQTQHVTGCVTHSVQSIIIGEVIHNTHHMSLGEREAELHLHQHTWGRMKGERWRMGGREEGKKVGQRERVGRG